MTASLAASPVSVHANQFHSKVPCLKLQQSALGGSLLCRPANKLVSCVTRCMIASAPWVLL